MQKVFFRNLAFLVSLNLLIKPIWILGIDRTVQNTVGQSEYGIYFALFNLSFLTQIFLDLGISSFNNKYLAQYQHEIKNYFSRIFTIKLLLSVFYICITIVAGYFLQLNSYQMILLGALAFNQILASLIIYVRSNISALHFFVMDSIFSVMDKAIMILICALLLFTHILPGVFSIEWFVLSQTIAYSFTLVYALIWLSAHSGWFRFSFDKIFSRQLMRDCLPFAILIFLMGVYNKTDGVMIERLLGNEGSQEAGIYASAYRLLDAMNQFGYLFAALLLPIFSRMISNKNKIDELTKTSFTLIFVFASMACLLIFNYRNNIMQLLYHETNTYSATVLGFIIFSFLGSSAIYIFSTLLTANGNLKQLIVIACGGTALNLVCNYLLIRTSGAAGAAMVCTITQITVAFSQILLAKNVFGFQINFKLIGKLILYFLLAATICYVINLLPIQWMLSAVLAAIFITAIAFVLRLFEIRKVLQLVKA